jgi:hypothetical protein
MSVAAPVSPAKKPSPPDEKFWFRYSRHHEMPLSWVGSGAVHLLGLGLLVLAGIAFPFLLKDNASLPMDVVALNPGPGGSGGENGIGNNPGAGASGENKDTLPIDDKDKFAKKLDADLESTPGPRPFLETLQDGFADRVIDKNNEAVKNILKLHKTTASGLHDGLVAGQGKGGPGQGGEKGAGNGPVNGDRKNQRPRYSHAALDHVLRHPKRRGLCQTTAFLRRYYRSGDP